MTPPAATPAAPPPAPAAPAGAPAPLLSVRGLRKHFPVRKGLFSRVVGQVKAVDDISFDIAPGETLGLVGESGCGKTTAGRSLLRLIEPTAGEVIFDGLRVHGLSSAELDALRRTTYGKLSPAEWKQKRRSLTSVGPKQLRLLRQHMQIIFQDPYASLNPRMSVMDIVGEGLRVHGLAKSRSDLQERVRELLATVRLDPNYANRYPHEFSGGQRQRIGIARALSLRPKFIVCDEAVSALDVSIQAQIINLLMDLREQFGLSYLFVAHDLSVVRHISHRVAVMYLGKIVELGRAADIFDRPLHPYTVALLSAVPVADPTKRRTRILLGGDVPSPLNPPPGCPFHPRCPVVMDQCRTQVPPLRDVGGGHSYVCHLEPDAPRVPVP